MTDLAATIDAAWEDRANISTGTTGEVRDAVEAALELLDAGEARVAEPTGGGWKVNQWLKKAVLLSFRLNDNEVIDGGAAGAPAFDKVPSKFAGWGENRFRDAGFRVVPGAVVRRGAFIGKGAVLMPSFVNIGAYVGEGTMVDTWATVGSCAQIGKQRPYLGRRRDRRRARAAPGRSGDHRRRLLHRRAQPKSPKACASARARCCRWASISAQSTKIVDRATGEVFDGRSAALCGRRARQRSAAATASRRCTAR